MAGAPAAAGRRDQMLDCEPLPTRCHHRMARQADVVADVQQRMQQAAVADEEPWRPHQPLADVAGPGLKTPHQAQIDQQLQVALPMQSRMSCRRQRRLQSAPTAVTLPGTHRAATGYRGDTPGGRRFTHEQRRHFYLCHATLQCSSRRHTSTGPDASSRKQIRRGCASGPRGPLRTNTRVVRNSTSSLHITTYRRSHKVGTVCSSSRPGHCAQKCSRLSLTLSGRGLHDVT